MTSTSKPIVFFGTEDFSLGALQALLDARFSVVAVVTKPDSPQGRGHRVTPPPVKILASKHNIPVWQPNKLREISKQIAMLNDPVGVLVSYGKIIPQNIIDLFTPGIINVHPSLLPKYRGPSPIESAILNGDTETGVSIMNLTAKMDAGPVYKQETTPLTQSEDSNDLYHLLGNQGSRMLIECLPAILNGSLLPVEQDNTTASYCHLIKKTDGMIDWNTPAHQIERAVRAYIQWPQSRATIGSIETIIIKAHIAPSLNSSPGTFATEDNRLLVQTATDAIAIDVIKPLGKKEMPIQAFLSGYRSQL